MDPVFQFYKTSSWPVIVPFHGEIDFSADNISIETCKGLYYRGFPYLGLTELGKKELYGIELVDEPSDDKHTPKKKKHGVICTTIIGYDRDT